jgi:prepilin-type N-terminal cleavage/methylation domain-containing protein
MMHKNCSHFNSREAFTLVELLVVIAIIGSLMGLLLPAIQSAREAGRRNTCMNNMSQLGKALFLHDNENGFVPGWRNSVEYTIQPTTGIAANAKRRAIVPWSVKILPYVERRDIYRLVEVGDPNQAVRSSTAVQIPLFECPSSPGENETTPRQCYAGNAGYGVGGGDTGVTTTGQRAPGNGVMTDAVGTTGQNGKRIALDAVSSQDGTSTTILLMESCGSSATNNRWDNDGNIAWDVDVSNNPTTLSVPSFPATFTTNMSSIKNGPSIIVNRGLSDDGTTVTFAGGDKPINPTVIGSSDFTDATGQPNWYPSSNHGAGVAAVFCDGHTQFVKDTIPFSVYAQLMSWDGINSRFGGKNNNIPLDRLPVLPADFAK